jgi:hypothetical protein
MRPIRALTVILLAIGTGACQDRTASAATLTLSDSARADSIARAKQDSINRAQPGYVVDSIFPPEEELRRFRKAIGGDSVVSLSGGSPSKEALAQRFVRAVVASDTNDLRAMVIHIREFADLYYPESPFSHAPYHQPPAFAWAQIQDPSLRSLTRLVRKLGGKPMTFVGVLCDPKVAREGRNTRYTGCLVRVKEANGQILNRRYFGSIVERDGQFKFLSYTNAL